MSDVTQFTDQEHKEEYERVLREGGWLYHPKWEDLTDFQKESIRKENLKFWEYLKQLGKVYRFGADMSNYPFYE